ncbi:MAG: division/cell wall cluster transcriptional repressor MraZ [Pseudomonadota bacterium]
MFVSTFETSLDSKGRVSVPAPFRHALDGGLRIFLYPALDGAPCLEGGGEALMQQNQTTLLRMSPTSTARKVFLNRTVSKAVELKLDDTGRIKIPEKHLAMAGIGKDLVFVGAMDRFYLWEPARYAAYDAEMEAQLDDVQPDFEGSFNAAFATGGIRGVVREGE